MAEKSARRLMLERSLAEDPGDTFLRYGLAVQCLREGDVEEGRTRLRALIAEHPDQVPAYQQLGQSYVESGETDAAINRAFVIQFPDKSSKEKFFEDARYLEIRRRLYEPAVTAMVLIAETQR